MSSLPQLQPLDQHNQLLQSHVAPPEWQNPSPEGRYNLVVIGAGPAGLVVAAGAAGLGARVALIERDLMGGDCLNVGCVPSKGIISAARAAAAVRNSQEFGIEVPDGWNVDFSKAMGRMRELRAGMSHHDAATRFTELGIDVYFGGGQIRQQRHRGSKGPAAEVQTSCYLHRGSGSRSSHSWSAERGSSDKRNAVLPNRIAGTDGRYWRRPDRQ
jgi:hypothetical protein